MQKCNKCLVEKSDAEFPKSSRRKSGLRATCKVCINTLNKQYRDCNKAQYNTARKRSYHANPEKYREYARQSARKSVDKKAAYDKVYRKENSEKIASYKRKWAIKRRQNNIEYRVRLNLRRRIHHVIRSGRKSASTMELLGCTIEFFLKHIESQFLPGMTWDNYGTTGWHIDHIKPCYTFDLTKEEDQKECFHYSNMRPLWAKDNLSRKRNVT